MPTQLPEIVEKLKPRSPRHSRGAAAVLRRPFLRIVAAALLAACGVPTETSSAGSSVSITNVSVLKPVLKTIDKSSAAPGDTITVVGENLDPVGAFFGPRAQFDGAQYFVQAAVLHSSTMLKFVVPPGKGIATLRVETTAGRSEPTSFVFKQGTITAVAPSEGWARDLVTIDGEGFGISGGTVGSYVLFGRTAVIPDTWVDNRIQLRAPADFGGGFAEDLAMGFVGCVGEAALGGGVVKKVFSLYFPGCSDILARLLQERDVRAIGDRLERSVDVVVHTAAGPSNAVTFVFRIDVVRPPVIISVSPSSMQLPAGGSGQITPTVSGSANTSVVYTTSNSVVAAVNTTGLVTAIGPGTATITVAAAADLSRKALVSVTVTAPPVTVTISAAPSSMALTTGGNGQITYTVTGSSNTSATCSTSNPSVATVSAACLVTAIGPGTATVTVAAAADLSRKALVSVTVTPVSSPTAPTAITTAATDVTRTGFQFNGSVNPNGTETAAYFEFSVTSSTLATLAFSSPATVGSGTGLLGFNDHLINGLCNTVYYYRLVAVNRFGTVTRGSIVQVRTLSC